MSLITIVTSGFPLMKALEEVKLPFDDDSEMLYPIPGALTYAD